MTNNRPGSVVQILY